MKRSELKVGDELYHARPDNWKRHQGSRVVVLAVEPYDRPDSWAVDRAPIQARTGNGVLVEFVRESGARDGDTMPTRRKPEVVQLSHLRGPYAETAAQVAEAAEAANLARRAVADERDDIQRYVGSVVERAKDAGLTGVRSDTAWHVESRRAARITVRTDELADLLDRLDGAHATIEALKRIATDQEGRVDDPPPANLGYGN